MTTMSNHQPERAHPTRTTRADVLADTAASVHADTQAADKRAARAHGKDRSTLNRWRNIGKGSPVHACLEYIAQCDDPMRVAATVLAAARMRELSDKSTPELIAMYWTCRRIEAEKEARDREMDSLPPADWVWANKADATARDGAVEIRKEAIQRVFAARRVSPADVIAWG